MDEKIKKTKREQKDALKNPRTLYEGLQNYNDTIFKY